jgi:predicted nucleotidyltransferase
VAHDLQLALRLKTVLAAGPRLRLAMLFGSAAKGTMRPDSDVDVAILPEDPDLPLRAELGLQVALTEAAGREVDLARLDRASTLLKWQVARHGTLLFASDRTSLDFAPAFARAAERFRRRLAA